MVSLKCTKNEKRMRKKVYGITKSWRDLTDEEKKWALSALKPLAE